MIVEKFEKLENRQVRLTIRVENDVWQKALKDCYEKNKAFYPVEGVAPGAATREQLEEAYGKEVLFQEGVNAAFPQALVEAVNEQKVEIAGTPALSVVTISSEEFVFAAVIDLYPEVKLGQYKGLKAVYPQAELSNDDADAAMDGFCKAHMTVTNEERAAMGDEVILDFEGFVDGVPFEGGKAEKYPLVLGSGMFIPGFEEQVAGIRVDEERDVNVTFPQAYTPELAGKAAVFKVKAHEIHRRTLPVLNDEFAKAQGFEDVKALRMKILEDALKVKESQNREVYADALIQQVIDSTEVEIPASMVDSQLKGLVQELERRLASQNMQLDDYLQAAGITRQDLENHARADAEKSARFELAMMEIARLENITVSDEEIQQKYQEMSDMYGMSLQQLHEQLPPVRLTHDIRIARARAVVIDSGIRG